jgi:hypothetical protein
MSVIVLGPNPLLRIGQQTIVIGRIRSRPQQLLIHTCKRGLSLGPLSVSSETQCLSSSPLSPRLELLPSRLTPREAKGGRP